MEKQRMTSDEWVGRLMTSSNPDPLLYGLVVGGAARREAREKYEALIEAAYTYEAKAWNRLSDIRPQDQEFIVVMSRPISFSKRFSTPGEILSIEHSEFRFRRRQRHGSLCEQWELAQSR